MASPPRPIEKEERGAAPRKEEEALLSSFLDLGVTRACWTLNCLRGRMISVGCVVLGRKRCAIQRRGRNRGGGAKDEGIAGEAEGLGNIGSEWRRTTKE